MSSVILAAIIAVKTPRDLAALNTRTFILCALVGVAAVVAAALLSQMVKYEGGSRPTDGRTRKMILWSTMTSFAGAGFGYNLWKVAPTVAANLQAKFMKTMSIGFAISAVVCLVLAFALSKVFSTGKLASWFPSKK